MYRHKNNSRWTSWCCRGVCGVQGCEAGHIRRKRRPWRPRPLSKTGHALNMLWCTGNHASTNAIRLGFCNLTIDNCKEQFSRNLESACRQFERDGCHSWLSTPRVLINNWFILRTESWLPLLCRTDSWGWLIFMTVVVFDVFSDYWMAFICQGNKSWKMFTGCEFSFPEYDWFHDRLSLDITISMFLDVFFLCQMEIFREKVVYIFSI